MSAATINTMNFCAIPYTAQVEILKSLSAKDMVLLAMNTNKDVLKTLVFLNLKITAQTIDVDFEKEEISVKFVNSSENFSVVFNKKSSTAKTIQLTSTNIAKGMLNVTGRLQHLFQGSLGNVTVDLKKFDDATWTRLEGLQCETFIVKGVARKIKKNNVSKILDSIKATKEILIEADLEAHRPSLKAVKLEKFVMKNSSGVNKSTLLKMQGKSKVVELEESSLGPKDINAFIKAWLTGTEKTTTLLKVTRDDEDNWNHHLLLKDLPVFKYQPENRDHMFVVRRTAEGLPEAMLPTDHGMDIRRSDGLLATVAFFGPILAFLVWQREHEFKDLVDQCTIQKMELEERLNQAVETHQSMELELMDNLGRIANFQEQIRKIDEKDVKDQSLGEVYHKKSLMMDVEQIEANCIKCQANLGAKEQEVQELSVKMGRVLSELDKWNAFL